MLTRFVHSITRQTLIRRSRKALRPDRSFPRCRRGQGWWQGGHGQCARGFPQAPVKTWIRRNALRASQGLKGFESRRYISLFEGFSSFDRFFGTLHRLLVSLSGLLAMRRSVVHIVSEGRVRMWDTAYRSTRSRFELLSAP